jgi:hypothetical protein
VDMESPYRKQHKRKNWFLQGATLVPPAAPPDNGEIRYEATRASGPGGSTSTRPIAPSAPPTSPAACRSRWSQRSQHANKKAGGAAIGDQARELATAAGERSRVERHCSTSRPNAATPSVFHRTRLRGAGVVICGRSARPPAHPARRRCRPLSTGCRARRRRCCRRRCGCGTAGCLPAQVAVRGAQGVVETGAGCPLGAGATLMLASSHCSASLMVCCKSSSRRSRTAALAAWASVMLSVIP